MNGIPITIVGNLTADPELRYTQDGIPVANFTVAGTERVYDRETNTWKDGDTVFLRTSAWRALGEHVAASLQKGMRVIATGKLKQRAYQDPKTNEPRTATELELDEVAVSLRYGTTVFTKSNTGAQDAPAAAPVAQGAPVNQAPVQQAYQPQGQASQQAAYQPQGYAAQAPAQPTYQPQGAPQAPAPAAGAPQAPVAQPVYAGAAVAGAQAASDDIF